MTENLAALSIFFKKQDLFLKYYLSGCAGSPLLRWVFSSYQQAGVTLSLQ